MRNMLVVCGLAIALSGCGSKPVISTAEKSASEKPLICDGKDQCDLYWQRAQFYVNDHSVFKIQLSNDALIQTFSPTGGDPSVGYNISKEPLGSGRQRLWVKLWCDNMFGCVPDVTKEIAKLKTYVETGK